MKKRTPFSQNGSELDAGAAGASLPLFRSKGGFDIGRCQSYMVDCSGLFRRTMVFIGFDHQIAKLKKRNAVPGGFVHRFQRRNKPSFL